MVALSPSGFVITVFLSRTRSEELDESSLEHDVKTSAKAPKRHNNFFMLIWLKFLLVQT
jgi:hypothetical protein